MLRPSLHLTLVAALSAASLTLPAPARALGPAAVDPDALYEEGRKDFSQGFYKSAIEKFEAAYKRSRDPLILYNIGQSYKKLHDEDPQLEFLKKARTALNNYVAAVEKDPSLGADPEEVKPLIAEIDAELARREPATTPEGPSEPVEKTVPERGEDPGKKLRLAGIGMIGGGGAMIVVGSIVGGVFAAKGGRLSEELNGAGGLYTQQKAMGCAATMTADETAPCAELRTDIEDTREAGQRSNRASTLSFALVGGIGALLVIGGAISFALGRKKTQDWKSETARVRVAPTFGGLMLHGRF